MDQSKRDEKSMDQSKDERNESMFSNDFPFGKDDSEEIDTVKNKVVKEYMSGRRIITELSWILNNITECIFIYNENGELHYQNQSDRRMFRRG